MKKIFYLIILCFYSLAISLFCAVEKNAGTTGAVFFRLGVGVRAIGMGCIYCYT